ncbi:helix-turn-helix domain-containing protein [Mesorhizobium sp. M0320]
MAAAKRSGWSQAEPAKAAGVSRATVVDFERGLRAPHPTNLDV